MRYPDYGLIYQPSTLYSDTESFLLCYFSISFYDRAQNGKGR